MSDSLLSIFKEEPEGLISLTISKCEALLWYLRGISVVTDGKLSDLEIEAFGKIVALADGLQVDDLIPKLLNEPEYTLMKDLFFMPEKTVKPGLYQ